MTPQNLIARRGVFLREIRRVFYVKSGSPASNFERGLSLGLSRFELFESSITTDLGILSCGSYVRLVRHSMASVGREINSRTNGNFFADDDNLTISLNF